MNTPETQTTVIDCDADPFIPDGWTKVEHKKGGQWEFNPDKIEFYFSKRQQRFYFVEGEDNFSTLQERQRFQASFIEGNELRTELVTKPVLNANVLDYLLAHPQIIPVEWKGVSVSFWGTIYCNPSGSLSVRCLAWWGGRWRSNHIWLGNNWRHDNPTAILKS